MCRLFFFLFALPLLQGYSFKKVHELPSTSIYTPLTGSENYVLFGVRTSKDKVKEIPVYRHDGSLYQSLKVDIGLTDAIHAGNDVFYLLGRTTHPYKSNFYKYQATTKKLERIYSSSNQAYIKAALWQNQIIMGETEGLHYGIKESGKARVAMPKTMHARGKFLYVTQGNSPYPEDDELLLFTGDLQHTTKILNADGETHFSGLSNYVDFKTQVAFSEFKKHRLYFYEPGASEASQTVETEYELEYLTAHGRCVIGVDRSAQMLEVWSLDSHKADLLIDYSSEGKALRNVMNIYSTGGELYLLSLGYERTANYLMKIEDEVGDELSQVCLR